MKRREFFGAAAAAAAVPALSAAPRIDTSRVKIRKTGKVEIVFKTPGPQPNGMQATKEGLWFIDQGPGNKAFLTTYDGKLLHEMETETERSSGITFDGEALWIGSTYSREEVRCDAKTGKAIERRFTPGAGVIYNMAGDAPARSSPVPQEMRQQRAAAPSGGGGGRREGGAGGGANAAAAAAPGGAGGEGRQVGGFQMGRLNSRAPGTGAHGQEIRDGKLWIVVPPSRECYRIDPKTWVVENKWPVAGNRPHGIGWEGRYLWVADSNLNAFFKHDPETGEISEKIQLAETDPLPHGMTIWDGYMWYCDDVGLACRLKL
jgi:streptogramin lyase